MQAYETRRLSRTHKGSMMYRRQIIHVAKQHNLHKSDEQTAQGPWSSADSPTWPTNWVN